LHLLIHPSKLNNNIGSAKYFQLLHLKFNYATKKLPHKYT